MIKEGFQGLQIGILGHPITVKITEFRGVKAETVKSSKKKEKFYLQYFTKINDLKVVKSSGNISNLLKHLQVTNKLTVHMNQHVLLI